MCLKSQKQSVRDTSHLPQAASFIHNTNITSATDEEE